MHVDARRIAIGLIAREHILTQRHLLDLIGKPQELRFTTSTDTDVLTTTLHNVLAELPADVSGAFTFPNQPEETVAVTTSFDYGAAVTAFALVDDAGAPWVAVAVVVPALQVTDPDAIDSAIHELTNDLNVMSRGAAPYIVHEQTVLHVAGAAHRLEPGMRSFYRLAAFLVTELLVAAEQHRGEPGPASMYQELLAIAEESSSDRFSASEIVYAALQYRDTLPPELARTVIVQELPNGASITIPFSTRAETNALTAVFMVDDDSAQDGLHVVSQFYHPLTPSDALAWASALNADVSVDQSAEDDTWLVTTPWTLGAWQMWSLPQGYAALVYRGRIPHTVRAYVRTEDIIRGVMHEVWSSSNRYRLHQEFADAIGGIDGHLL